MTKQVDELMREIDQVLDINTTDEWDALRKLLEAALKPGGENETLEHVPPSPATETDMRIYKDIAAGYHKSRKKNDLFNACKDLIAYCDNHPPMGDSLWSVQRIRAAINEVEGAAPPAQTPDHGPQAETVSEAARDVGKWLVERPNRPIDLRHVAMLAAHATHHFFDATKKAPPRLTDGEIHNLDPLQHVMFDAERIDFARAIESAVRKQWSEHFGVNDE
jgi:hypothetical protein